MDATCLVSTTYVTEHDLAVDSACVALPVLDADCVLAITLPRPRNPLVHYLPRHPAAPPRPAPRSSIYSLRDFYRFPGWELPSRYTEVFG